MPECDRRMRTLRIQMCCQRRGDGKRNLAPNGGELPPPTKPEPDGTLVKAVARAWRRSGWMPGATRMLSRRRWHTN